TVTEMVRAKALVYKDEKTKSLLYIPEDEGPCSAQIFGHEPEIMAEAAGLALEISGAGCIAVVEFSELQSTCSPQLCCAYNFPLVTY
ncbi:MAG: tRNA-dihydrouridine synthase, partial [Bacteroidaceae bacterium]|nr:tRNA-dihydrouridine synthase [Bacteroidaceae bacterium]